MATVHIIGAGLAGLAAAVALVPSGKRLCLYESTAQAGGRCRSYADPVLGRVIDNGNHLLLGCNQHARDYIGRIGAHAQFHSPQNDYPFTDLKYGGEWVLSAPTYLPRVPLVEYLSLALMGLRGGTVARAMSRHARIYRRMVEPLCVSMLNTPAQTASARLLARTLRQARGDASALLPLGTLHDALIAPALSYLQRKEVEIYYQQSLKQFVIGNGHVDALRFTRSDVTLSEYDQVILAVPPNVIPKLLPDQRVPLAHHAIVNGHFAYEHGQKNGSFRGVIGASMDWVFFKDGMLSTTTSAADRYTDFDQDMVAQSIWRDVCSLMKWEAPLPPYRLVSEKRATFAATPANLALRPAMHTPYRNLWLAGDYVKSNYPATIEGAIASGFAAASAVFGM